MAATGSVNTGDITTGAADRSASAYIWRAPIGTEVPTDATTDLPSAFVCVGCIDKDGITQSVKETRVEEQDMRGVDVYDELSDLSITYKMKIMETSANSDKIIWGKDSVTVGADGSWATRNVPVREEGVWVWETLLKNGMINRTVVPRGKVNAVGDISKKPGEVRKPEITLKTLADDTGTPSYDYYAEAE